MVGVRNRNLWFVGSFLVLIHVPLVANLTEFDPGIANRENRAAESPPELPSNLMEVVVWPRDLRRYYDDTFGLRDGFTYIYSNVLYHGLGVVPFGRVSIRSDGWAFANLPHDDSCEKRALRGAELQALVESVIAARSSADRAESDYLLVLVPSKSWVYQPKAPQRACPSDETTSGRLAAALVERDPAFPVVDLFPALVEAKQRERIYFLDDPHWNDLGAFVAYQGIVEALRARFPTLRAQTRSDFDRVEREHLPGAYSRFANLSLESSVDVFLVPRKRRLAKLVFPEDAESGGIWKYERRDTVYVREPGELPEVLVFRNSFFEQLRPLLAEHFERTTYVWEDFNAQRVARERPDLVIDQRTF